MYFIINIYYAQMISKMTNVQTVYALWGQGSVPFSLLYEEPIFFYLQIFSFDSIW